MPKPQKTSNLSDFIRVLKITLILDTGRDMPFFVSQRITSSLKQGERL